MAGAAWAFDAVYTPEDTLFLTDAAAEGLQIAAGVPLAVGEGDGFSTFRLGLFGLDKLGNVERSVATLEQALDKVMAP